MREYYYGVRIGKLPHNHPYLAVDDRACADGTSPAIFQCKEDAIQRRKRIKHRHASVVKVCISFPEE